MADKTDRLQPISTAMIGGSFDPVHLGHLHLIHCVVENTGYQRIILIPVALNNFKQGWAHPADAADRLAMLRLAVSQYREMYPQDRSFELIVEPCELDRGGVSYTYDTVGYLYRKYPTEGKLAIVMGDDLVGGLSRWHRFSELKDLVRFVVCRRESSAPVTDLPQGAEVQFIENVVKEDSSSHIRQRCADLAPGMALPVDVASLMPAKVAEYVQEHRLYRA